MKKENKGITLVALVITIIVLIILAGVSINAVMNGGLIDNAKDAKNEFEVAKTEEEKILSKLEVEAKDAKVEQEFVANGVEYKFKNTYLTGIASDTKVSDLRQELQKAGYDVYDSEGNTIDDTTAVTTLVGTGMIIKKEEQEIGTVIIFGDFDGVDGIVGADKGYLNSALTGGTWGDFEESTKIAMDVTHDGVLNYEDANYIEASLQGGEQIVQDKFASAIEELEVHDIEYVKQKYIVALQAKNNQYSITKSGDAYILNGVEAGIKVKELADALPENTVMSKKKPSTLLGDDVELAAGNYKLYVISDYLGAETQVEVATFTIE